ncbi:MAG: aminotransferase class IV [Alphaproteobacteria bacterium]|nr:aminotransferase class IV [Alphaproteobacteria bacterium]
MALAYNNGSFVEKNTITISLADFGFSRGLAFFETMRVYGGAPFHMADHLLRLQKGAEQLGLSLPLTLPDIEAVVHRICAHNKFPHSTVKFYFTAGEARLSPYSLGGDHDFTPHLIVVEDEMKPDHPDAPFGLEFYKRGQRIKTVPHERALPKVKSISYLQAYYAAREAGPEWDDILFTHRDGYVTEATRANFFCVIDGVLSTPFENILDGVTRKVVLEIAEDEGIPVAECRLMPADLATATEAFTSGSPIEMVPARKIDDHILPTTMDGPVFRQLRKAFTAKIEESCRVFSR